MKNTIYLVLFLVACKSSDADTQATNSCAIAAPKLAKQLKDGKAVSGTKVELKNCVFGMQSGDVLSFAGSVNASTTIDCVLEGDKASQEALRTELELNFSKLKLDVVGTIGTHQGAIKLTGCKITPHE